MLAVIYTWHTLRIHVTYRKITLELGDTKSVSYTHLDVYKRQDERETVVRDTPGYQPDKPIQKEDMSMQEMLRILMEGNNKTSEILLKQINEKLDRTNRK